MKKNIGLLTVVSSLLLGGTVFATSPEQIALPEVTKEEIEIGGISTNYKLNINLPKEYEELVTVMEDEVYASQYRIIAIHDDVAEDIGEVVVVVEDDIAPTILFQAEGVGFQSSKTKEIVKYIEDNFNEVFEVEFEEVDEYVDMVTVYDGEGYMIQMPAQFEEEIMVISTRSIPPQLIFNYKGEETTPIARLEIIKGEYEGDGNVVKVGNGYTFVLEINEVEEASERFEEIQSSFVNNAEDLILLAMDYDGGEKVVIVNGVEVAEYIPVGIGEYMVPLRVVSESLGMDVTWNSETKDIDVTNGKQLIKIDPNDEVYAVNRAFKMFHRKPIIENGVTYVPLTFITDGLGLKYNIEYGKLVIS